MMPYGSVRCDPDQVIRKWNEDFQELYKCSFDPDGDEEAVLSEMEGRVAAWREDYEAAVSSHAIPEDEPQRSTHMATMQLNAPITLQETLNALKHAKNGKAVGIDNIPNEILKVPLLQEILCEKSCFEKNKIPSVWYKAIIHPILKPEKSPLFPLSHRGINLISTFAEVFSTILNTRLSNFAENQMIYAEELNGFRKMRSCLDHLHSLTTVTRNRKAQKLSTFCVFIDNDKAFDSVHYPYLWYKLSAAGVHGHMFSMIQTIYSNMESSVRVNGCITDWFAQTAGVRQRDTLALTLFALFINDLVPEINGFRWGVTMSNELTLSILLYADDVVLISETEDGLQTMLN